MVLRKGHNQNKTKDKPFSTGFSLFGTTGVYIYSCGDTGDISFKVLTKQEEKSNPQLWVPVKKSPDTAL